MPPRDYLLLLDGDTRSPLYVRIARAVSRDVLAGRLRPGDALPGTRSLAVALGVHRSTVVTAYAELAAQGWIATRPGGKSVVTRALPELPVRRNAGARRAQGLPDQPGFALEPAPVVTEPPPDLPRGAIALWGGVPDVRLVPVDLLARAYRRAAKQHGHALLAYTHDARGHPALRDAMARRVSSARGLNAGAGSLLITRGSQMALDLVARSLLQPGDGVAMEALCYRRGADVFRRAGARLWPVPVDAEGLDVDALEALARTTPLRLLYVTPHHQYPTTVTLSATRRLKLLELARRLRLCIVEDDYDQEFHYDGRPVAPLASSDPHGNVLYVGTFAKVLAPGLRLGFVVAPRALIDRMAHERALIDRQGDSVLECAVAELIEDGEVQRHVNRARRIYHARRDALCNAVQRWLGGSLSFRKPAGGLALWAEVDPELPLALWQERAARAGVYFQIGRQFSLGGEPVPALRTGYALHDEPNLERAVRRMADSLPRAGYSVAKRWPRRRS